MVEQKQGFRNTRPFAGFIIGKRKKIYEDNNYINSSTHFNTCYDIRVAADIRYKYKIRIICDIMSNLYQFLLKNFKITFRCLSAEALAKSGLFL